MATAGTILVYNVSVPVDVNHICAPTLANSETIDGLVALVVVPGLVNNTVKPVAMEHVVYLTATVNLDYEALWLGPTGNVTKIAETGRAGR